MKKASLLLLVLMLLVTGASAITVDLPQDFPLFGADGPLEIKVVEDSFLNYESAIWGRDALYTAVFENASGADALVFKADLEGLDKEGQVVFTKPLYNVYPFYLESGKTAVAIGNNLGITPEEFEKMASWRLSVVGQPASEEGHGTISLPVTAEFESHAQDDGLGGTAYNATITANVNNNTENPVFDAVTVVLLRDAEGKLISGVNMSAFDVGILPGSGVLLRTVIFDDLIKYLAGEARVITSAEAYTYVNIEPAL